MLNSHQKFSKALEVCKKIANVLPHCSQADFERKLGKLKFLNEAWCEGKEIGLQTFPDLSGTSDDVAPEVAETRSDVETKFEAAEADVVVETEVETEAAVQVLGINCPHAASSTSDESDWTNGYLSTSKYYQQRRHFIYYSVNCSWKRGMGTDYWRLVV